MTVIGYNTKCVKSVDVPFALRHEYIYLKLRCTGDRIEQFSSFIQSNVILHLLQFFLTPSVRQRLVPRANRLISPNRLWRR